MSWRMIWKLSENVEHPECVWIVFSKPTVTLMLIRLHTQLDRISKRNGRQISVVELQPLNKLPWLREIAHIGKMCIIIQGTTDTIFVLLAEAPKEISRVLCKQWKFVIKKVQLLGTRTYSLLNCRITRKQYFFSWMNKF